MEDDLSPIMKDRLEKWRKNTLTVKSAEKIVGPSASNYRQVRGDYGDDIRDFENKQDEVWGRELQNNQIYTGYR